MSQYDLAGNPLPGSPDEQEVRYDLAGNPLPVQPRPIAPAGVTPPGAYDAPIGGPPPAAPTYPQNLGAYPPQGVQPPPGYAPPPGAYPPQGEYPQQPGAYPPQGGYPQQPGVYGQPGGYRPAAPEPKKTFPVGVGVGAGIAAFFLAFFLVRLLHPAGTEVPGAYLPYVARDEAFKCDQPANWRLNEFGVMGGNGSWATFKSGPSRIHVSSDMFGSIIAGGISTPNTSSDPNAPPPPPPIIKLHEMGATKMSDEFQDYQETDAKPIPNSAMSPDQGRVSEFTAKGGMFTGKIHGYRATLLGMDRRITVLVYSPESEWPKMQPAYDHIISTVTDAVPHSN